MGASHPAAQVLMPTMATREEGLESHFFLYDYIDCVT
jgi:hypothetical protein